MPVVIDGTSGIDTIQNNTVTSAKIVDGSVTPADTQVGALPSMVRTIGQNGYGSTATKIRRWTTIVTNQGTDISYVDSAANGASYTVNTNGTYAIQYTDVSTATLAIGISLNSANLTTNADALSATELLACDDSTAVGAPATAAWTGYLPAGSVIRPHSSGSAASGSSSSFTITRVA